MALGIDAEIVQRIDALEMFLKREDRAAVLPQIGQLINELCTPTTPGGVFDINRPLDGPATNVTDDPHSPSHGGTTLAHYAASQNYGAILRYLDELGTASGTPINYASQRRERVTTRPTARFKNESITLLAIQGNNREAIRSLVRADVARVAAHSPSLFEELDVTIALANDTEAAKTLRECQDAQRFQDLPINFTDPALTTAAVQNCLPPLPTTPPVPPIPPTPYALSNINAVDDNGLSVAHHLVGAGRIDILEELINNGYLLNVYAQQGTNGPSVLDRIPTAQDKQRIQRLYDQRLAESDLTQLDWRNATLDQVQAFENRGATLNVQHAFQALEAGKSDIVKYMIERVDLSVPRIGPPPERLAERIMQMEDRTLLLGLVERACRDGNPNCLQNSSGHSVLDSIGPTDPQETLKQEIRNSFEATQQLLDPTRIPLRPPLVGTYTWETIEEEQLNDLLNAGALINARDPDGRTGLSRAIEADNLRAAQFFVDHDARLDIPDNNGNVPAHWAVRTFLEHGTGEMIDLLVEKHAPFNVRNRQGQNPAHVAMETIENLVSLGAPPPDPLIIRAFVEKLIQQGVDFEAPDNGDRGATPPVPPRKPLDYLPNSPEYETIKQTVQDIIEDSKREENLTDEELGFPPSPEAQNNSNPDASTANGGQSADASAASSSGNDPGVVKKVSDSLKAATDGFFKNVFEGNHNTAEAFAQAFLFNLLTFPLEAANTYLTKKYDPDEKDYLKNISATLNSMAAKENGITPLSNAEIDASQQTKDLGILANAINIADPEAIQLLKTAIGETTPPDLSKMTPQQLEERSKRIQDALIANPQLVTRFQNAFARVSQVPETKAVVNRLFQGHSGPVTADQLVSLFSEKTPTNGTTGPTIPPGATPNIQQAITDSYLKIMNSTALDRDQKATRLAGFLIEQAEQHPEFKTLSKAFSLVQRNDGLLRDLENPAYVGRRGLTRDGVRLLQGNHGFDGYTQEELQETVSMIGQLRGRLRLGSERGASDPNNAVLTGLITQQANKIQR